ncbi:MAG: hypothetical protein AAFV33_12585 [Chloroflexota bacterium]
MSTFEYEAKALKPLPDNHAVLRIDRTLSEDEYRLITRGKLEPEMEERWLAYFHEQSLYLFRSWTGSCAFVAPVTSDGMKHMIFHVMANRGLFRNNDDDALIEEFRGILEHVVFWPLTPLGKAFMNDRNDRT